MHLGWTLSVPLGMRDQLASHKFEGIRLFTD